jgi:hypothetical protein
VKLTPKNWAEFQHYKDRAPTWIKLHKNLIDDSKFQRLPVASRALAPMLWLLASECEGGTFEADPSELAFRLRQTEKEIHEALEPLISKGFFIVEQSASNPLAEVKQESILEKRRDREEKEERREEGASAPLLDGLNADAWGKWVDYRKQIRKPLKPVSMLAAQRELTGFGANQMAVVERSIANGWTGLFALKGAGGKPEFLTQKTHKEHAVEEPA